MFSLHFYEGLFGNMTAPALLSFFSGEGRRHLDFVFFFPFCLCRWKSCAFSRPCLRIYGKIKNRGEERPHCGTFLPPARLTFFKRQLFGRYFRKMKTIGVSQTARACSRACPVRRKGGPGRLLWPAVPALSQAVSWSGTENRCSVSPRKFPYLQHCPEAGL